MTGVCAAAVLPAAPLMLAAASPDQPEASRTQVRRLRDLANEALAGLPQAEVVVLLATGVHGIHDSARASLAPLGIAGAEVELPVPKHVVEHLSRLVQYPMLRGAALSADLAVLALQVHEARGTVPVLPVSVPPGMEFDVLVGLGASVDEAVRAAETDAVVVVAGDLSSGLDESSPGYAIPGASAFDEAVVAAVRRGDLDAIRTLGPAEAERVGARGWVALSALHGVCVSADLRLELLGYDAPRGVGQIVARCSPDGMAAAD